MSTKTRSGVATAIWLVIVAGAFLLGRFSNPGGDPPDAPVQLVPVPVENKLDAPPISVLTKLPQRFKNIKPDMGEADVFKMLGLDQYSDYLSMCYKFQMGGGGSNHKTYLLPGGQQLEFRDWMGNNPECLLYVPGMSESISAKIGEQVTNMAGFHEFINGL